jgi:hypothetical protein
MKFLLNLAVSKVGVVTRTIFVIGTARACQFKLGQDGGTPGFGPAGSGQSWTNPTCHNPFPQVGRDKSKAYPLSSYVGLIEINNSRHSSSTGNSLHICHIPPPSLHLFAFKLGPFCTCFSLLISILPFSSCFPSIFPLPFHIPPPPRSNQPILPSSLHWGSGGWGIFQYIHPCPGMASHSHHLFHRSGEKQIATVRYGGLYCSQSIEDSHRYR